MKSILQSFLLFLIISCNNYQKNTNKLIDQHNSDISLKKSEVLAKDKNKHEETKYFKSQEIKNKARVIDCQNITEFANLLSNKKAVQKKVFSDTFKINRIEGIRVDSLKNNLIGYLDAYNIEKTRYRIGIIINKDTTKVFTALKEYRKNYKRFRCCTIDGENNDKGGFDFFVEKYDCIDLTKPTKASSYKNIRSEYVNFDSKVLQIWGINEAGVLERIY